MRANYIETLTPLNQSNFIIGKTNVLNLLFQKRNNIFKI